LMTCGRYETEAQKAATRPMALINIIANGFECAAFRP